MWKNWIAAVAGLWTIIVPFIGISGAALVWTLVVTGAIVAILSIWSIAEMPEYSQRLQHRTR